MYIIRLDNFELSFPLAVDNHILYIPVFHTTFYKPLSIFERYFIKIDQMLNTM